MASGALTRWITDGQRYAAYKPDAETIAVLDGRTGKTSRFPSTCAPFALRKVTVLLDCGANGRPAPTLLMSATTGDVFEAPGDQPNDRFGEIGTQWLRGSFASPATYGALNWHTGERRSDLANGYYDLDNPDLVKIDSRALPTNHTGLYSIDGGDNMVINFRSKRYLSLCARACDEPTLTGGIATWVYGAKAYAYVLRPRRQYTWNFPKFQPDRGVSPRVHVGHSAGRVLIATETVKDDIHSYQLYSKKIVSGS